VNLRGGSSAGLQDVQNIGRLLGVELQVHPLQNADDLEPAFDAAGRGQADALLVMGGPVFTNNQARILDLAAQQHLPAMYPLRDFADAGGLMAYSASAAASHHDAAAYVSKILKGASPTDLPVEGPTGFDFVVNLKTAQ